MLKAVIAGLSVAISSVTSVCVVSAPVTATGWVVAGLAAVGAGLGGFSATYFVPNKVGS